MCQFFKFIIKMSQEGNGMYYSCCDCEEICECAVTTPTHTDDEANDSPFPDYITNYVISRTPMIILYNVNDDDDYDDDFPYSILTSWDDQARELTIEPASDLFYNNALAYICSIYGCDPDEHIDCVYWDSQVSIN